MTKILIVDDHPVIRCGLRGYLQQGGEVVEVGEAASGGEAMTRIRAEGWDAVLLDITLPGRGGMELLTRIKAERPELPVLAFNMHRDGQYAVRAIEAGANGFIGKAFEPDELMAAVRCVVRGAKYITDAVAALLAEHVSNGTARGRGPRHEHLSDREYQVFLALAIGRRLTEIAREFGLTPQAIATNRKRALSKMGLSSNADLTIYALRHGLLELPPE